jgi:hypothetical protein
MGSELPPPAVVTGPLELVARVLPAVEPIPIPVHRIQLVP